MEELATQALLLGLDLYRAHYKKEKDWVPTKEEIAAILLENARMTARQYELDAAKRLGVEPPPPIVN